MSLVRKGFDGHEVMYRFGLSIETKGLSWYVRPDSLAGFPRPGYAMPRTTSLFLYGTSPERIGQGSAVFRELNYNILRSREGGMARQQKTKRVVSFCQCRESRIAGIARA
jgi:hypothetical protein